MTSSATQDTPLNTVASRGLAKALNRRRKTIRWQL